MTGDGSNGYYASYFEVIAPPVKSGTIFARRWQWIVMPHVRGSFVIFYREQSRQGHTSLWRHNRYLDPTSITRNVEAVLRVTGHVLHGPVVVRLTQSDLDKYLPEDSVPKTPWTVIETVDKVCSLYGFRMK